MKNQSLLKRLYNAGQGIRASFLSEMNFRLHIMATLLVLIMLIVTRPDPLWWAILLLVSGLVLTLELINTALEKLIDHMHPDQHAVIGIVKDTLAGAVLLASLIALCVFMAFVIEML
ncbi:MAG: diacylglycerol kinase [Emcibacter sp.]|nr:diacylglycerol kinase [Emcibacter sp.]